MDEGGVKTFFVVVGSEDQITVLVSGREIGEIAVLVLKPQIHRRQRHRVMQLVPLVEKNPVKIEIPAEAHGIPLIGMPDILLVNLERFVGGINGQNRLAGKITLTAVKPFLVSPGQPSLPPAIGAERRRRNGIFFTAEYRRNHLVKFLVLLWNRERRFALSASFLHRQEII